MTHEEIIKGNRVIAEAMGGRRIINEGWLIDNIIGMPKDFQLKYHSDWDWLMPAIELIRDQMGLHTVWQTMKALQENYAKVSPEYFQTITDIWKAVVIYFESKK